MAKKANKAPQAKQETIICPVGGCGRTLNLLTKSGVVVAFCNCNRVQRGRTVYQRPVVTITTEQTEVPTGTTGESTPEGD